VETPRSPTALKTGLILVDDLMFASQIQSLARSAGFQLQWVRNAEKALAQAQANRPVCVILDVNLIGEEIDNLVVGLKGTGGSASAVIGFGSHVDATSLQRARAAGCDLVMPRSKLVQEIAANLPRWIDTRSSELPT
jgi:DNA-binding response OmpR family regulator